MKADPGERRRPAWGVPADGIGAGGRAVSGDGIALGVAPAFDGVRALVVPVARATSAQEPLVKAVAHGAHDRTLGLQKPKRMEYLGRKRLQRFGILGHVPLSAPDGRDLRRFCEGKQ